MNLDAMEKIIKRQTRDMCKAFGIISLGKLIRELEQCKEDSDVRFDFCYFYPGELMSYRGYYDHLAFSPEETQVTVKDVLKECREANGGTFEGYKGGDFRMDDSTPVWVSPYGSSSGTGIVGVRELEYGYVILETAYCET